MGDLKFERIFITGGAGYVGSALVPKLLEDGYNVTVYDLFIYGDTLEEHSNLRKIKGDIREREKLIDATKEYDALIHLACISNDPSFDLDPELGKSINYGAFPNVLDAAKRNNVKRFILASSTSQYGIKDPKIEITEDIEAEPITDYAKYKIECEKLTRKSDLGDMEYVFVRPATLCGYAPRLRLDLSVNILTISALEDKIIKIFGGDQLRPALNIEDMVRAYELMLVAPREKINGEAFNVAYQNMSIRDMAELVKSTIGNPEILFETTPSNDMRSYHINSDKIKRILGFENKFSIRDAISSLIKAYKEGLIADGLNNPIYHNVRQMKLINLR